MNKKDSKIIVELTENVDYLDDKLKSIMINLNEFNLILGNTVTSLKEVEKSSSSISYSIKNIVGKFNNG